MGWLMRCEICGYRLWNLTSRQCPECGTPFLPSQYEFVPNSVQFCCPHCGTAYYGTGEKGHPSPVEFNCVSCGRRVHMNEMVLLPTEGVAEERTKPRDMPWLDRKERGRMRGWLATVGKALVAPVQLMQATPVDSSVGQAWWFAVVTCLAMLVAFVPFVLMPISFAGLFPGMGAPSGAGLLAGVGMAFGMVTAIVVVGSLLGISIWGAITHGLLRLTGGALAGIGRTYQAICYSSGANTVTAVPCIGVYFGWIWWLVSAVLMVKEAQQVHGGRASFAVLFLPILLIATLIGLYVWLIISSISAMGGAFPTTMPSAIGMMAENQTSGMVMRIHMYAMDHDDRGPRHAIEMADDPDDADRFVVFGSGTTAANVPVGDTTLEQFKSLPRAKRREVIQRAIDITPTDTIAHRLGDFVFVYHGIDVDEPDRGLWLVIFSPDPESGVTVPYDSVHIGLADDSVVTIPKSTLAGRLEEQNTLRAKYGLAPLPDPSTVTHAKPAVAGRPAPDTQPGE